MADDLEVVMVGPRSGLRYAHVKALCLYELRKQLCRDLDLRGIVAGGVIPGYADHKHRMSADDYIAEVVSGRLYDPTLSFQLENGFEAPCALEGYITDPAVDSYAALIVWHNPDFNGDAP